MKGLANGNEWINEKDDCFYVVQEQPAVDDDEDENIREMFRKISGDDFEVDSYELQNILNAVFMKGGLTIDSFVLSSHMAIERRWSFFSFQSDTGQTTVCLFAARVSLILIVFTQEGMARLLSWSGSSVINGLPFCQRSIRVDRTKLSYHGKTTRQNHVLQRNDIIVSLQNVILSHTSSTGVQ